jgi:hypothetical protein
MAVANNREKFENRPMGLFQADIIAEVIQLSPGLNGFILVTGMLLAILSWRWHRFWVVLGITILGGWVGLKGMQANGGHVLAVGLLLAVSSGLLAVEIAKILMYLAGGIAAWFLVNLIMPGGRDLWVVFLLGGLMAVSLYRLGFMLLGSFLGVLFWMHAALGLAHKFAQIPAVEWTTKYGLALHGIFVFCVTSGWIFQVLLDRYLRREEDPDDDHQNEHRHHHKHHSRGISWQAPSHWMQFLRKKGKPRG